MEGSTPQDPQEPTEPQEQPEPTPGEQGEPVPADPTAPAQPDGFNPDEPVRTSAPPAEDASGVPDLPGGANADVEPGVEPGPREEAGQSETGSHPEANQGGADAAETGDPALGGTSEDPGNL